MGTLHRLTDTLVNFVTSLGTFKDPARSSNYALTLLDRNQLENAYRGDWIARKIVDAPAEDATREWRSWQASNDQIEAIEECEKKLKLQRKLKMALIRARLYGGGALVMGVDDGNQNDEPLNLDGVKEGALKFVVVMNRYELSAGPRIYNVDSEWYTRPEYYVVQTPLFGFSFEQGEVYPGQSSTNVLTIGQRAQGQAPAPAYKPQQAEGDRERMVVPFGGLIRIHPSRVIEFAGNELPDWRLAPMGGGWGDSVLQTADDTLREWGLTIGGVAAMVNDAKMDVIKIKDFSKNIATKEYAQRLLQRFALANQSKSTINSILLDVEEEWDRVQTNFGGLPNLVSELMTVVAGAGNLPVSRLFGKAGAKGLGKSSSGQDELRNYYDGVASEQKNEITPVLEPLDQVLVRSALGKYDPNIHYTWSPLYLPEPGEAADVQLKKAQAYQIDVNTGMINEDALRTARINQLIEDGAYPGLEDAIEEFGEEPEVVEARVWSPGYDPVTGKPLAAAAPKPGLSPPAKPLDGLLRDATPRTLYIRRQVLNGDVIRRWAKAQGFKTVVDDDSMHVTIAFSKIPVDWVKVGEASPSYEPAGKAGEEQAWLTVPDGGPRLVEKFGDAVVLVFASSALAWRHEQAKLAGASWDHPDYNPHVTISWNAAGMDLSKVVPYRGPIELGPEIFEEIAPDWRATVHED